MFGESESESPRVPSPWDFLISPSPSPRPSPLSGSPNPSTPNLNGLTIDSIPRLVPENDEGNVEYKLQLLNPSPARFARLVTQLKWRLLEGGGQAYYELGVADSGALVGLPRPELEQSLETLEMMAGEIGASVIVVKEIEVPAVIAGIAATQTDTWNGRRRKRAHSDLRGMLGSEEGSESPTAILSWTSTTETETEPSSTDFDPEDEEDLSMTIVLDSSKPYPYQRPETITPRCGASIPIFVMDPDPDPAENADAEPDEDLAATVLTQTYFSVDLEISTVFKPRPMRARMHTHLHSHTLGATSTKTKRLKKIKHITHPHEHQRQNDYPHQHDHRHNHHHNHHHHQRPQEQGDGGGPNEHYGKHDNNKALTRRQMRDRRREEKRRALVAFATTSTNANNLPKDSNGANTSVEPCAPGPAESLTSPLPSAEYPKVQVEMDGDVPAASATSELVSQLGGLHVAAQELEPVNGGVAVEADDVDEDDVDDVFATPTAAKPLSGDVPNGERGIEEGTHGQGQGQRRLIVEALVVRKMSLDEAFLDFGGFTLV